MKVLNCKVCDNPTECSEEAVAVTCHLCTSNPNNEYFSEFSEKFNFAVEEKDNNLFSDELLYEVFGE